MNSTARAPSLIEALLVIGLLAAGSGCSDTATATGQRSFCSTMKEVTDLLEPNAGSTTPTATKARYDRVSALLTQAKGSAPRALVHDIGTFATAIHGFSSALAKVGYSLDALFTTPAGATLAAATSHALTPAIVDELTGPCGLDLGAPRPAN